MHFTLCTSLYALHSMHFTLCTSLYALQSMLLCQGAPHGRTLRDAFGKTQRRQTSPALLAASPFPFPAASSEAHGLATPTCSGHPMVLDDLPDLGLEALAPKAAKRKQELLFRLCDFGLKIYWFQRLPAPEFVQNMFLYPILPRTRSKSCFQCFREQGKPLFSFGMFIAQTKLM